MGFDIFREGIFCLSGRLHIVRKYQTVTCLYITVPLFQSERRWSWAFFGTLMQTWYIAWKPNQKWGFNRFTSSLQPPFDELYPDGPKRRRSLFVPVTLIHFLWNNWYMRGNHSSSPKVWTTDGERYQTTQTAQTFRVAQRGGLPDRMKEPCRHRTAPTSFWSPSSAMVTSTCEGEKHRLDGLVAAYFTWLEVCFKGLATELICAGMWHSIKLFQGSGHAWL